MNGDWTRSPLPDGVSLAVLEGGLGRVEGLRSAA
ncbi:MAG: hypothetical protein RLZZ272_1316, partial [Actinomycetota bacterium]